MNLQFVFVYGTLKTGQIRERSWPRRPVSIELGWTLGVLYDTGPYPALVAGQDAVAGEVWGFEEADMTETLEVLDRIEGTNQPDEENYYNRERATVFLQKGGQREAFLYRFARLDQVTGFGYLQPKLDIGGQLLSIWPEECGWELKE